VKDDEQLRLVEELERIAGELAALREGQDLLASVLTARGDLEATHAPLVERVRRAKSRRHGGGRVYLEVLRDKYQVTGPEIDCPSLLHLCKARCCSMRVALTEQDLEEGGLKWEIQRPYLLLRDGADGYCTYLDRATSGCRVYERRPVKCREYDCRQDHRVWHDFERKIPAPFTPGPRP